MRRVVIVISTVFMMLENVYATVPEITGSPEIDTPQLLSWPLDIPSTTPDLSEPTSNRIFDLHARISNCTDTNIVLSTAGNYHMALRDLWYDYYLPRIEHLVQNWYYTTSPPVSPEQIQNKSLTFGNIRLECTPSIAVGPAGLMAQLIEQGVIDGEPLPVIRNHGNVILVKKGNPKNIQSIWDLGRPGVRVVTSNPDSEVGSFTNYSNSVYNIAANDEGAPNNWSADLLFNVIFNGKKHRHHNFKHADVDNERNEFSHYKKRHNAENKWLAGQRIHHREVPWSIAYGKADAGLLFYHLALYMVRTFPEQFEIVPLGGTAQLPEPVEGNKAATLFIARISGDFNQNQLQAREELIDAYLSVDFDIILQRHGLRRPDEFRQ